MYRQQKDTKGHDRTLDKPLLVHLGWSKTDQKRENCLHFLEQLSRTLQEEGWPLNITLSTTISSLLTEWHPAIILGPLKRKMISHVIVFLWQTKCEVGLRKTS